MAKTMMDGLIQLSQDAVIKLEGEPVSTIDYVNVLKYVNIKTITMDCFSHPSKFRPQLVISRCWTVFFLLIEIILTFLYSSFMDEIQDKIDGIEGDSDTVKELYELIDQYQVPVNPEDLAVYQVIIALILLFPS